MTTDDRQTGDDASDGFEIRSVLYPTDFSDLSLYALRYARHFARVHYATLHCLHVVDEAYQYVVGLGPDSVPVGPPTEDLVEAADRQMDAFVDQHLANEGFPVKRKVVAGRPFVTIIEYARNREIDLIVIATHGRTGLKSVLLGSVAEKVVRKSPCPVLTIRHPEQKFVMP